MDTIELSDLDILNFGNSIQLSAAVYSNNEKNYLCILPDEITKEVLEKEFVYLHLTSQDWEVLLKQTDILNVLTGPAKAIVRKSQRQIDQVESWAVYRRDGFRCRYCGRNDVPLTVDHIDLWEDGGVSTRENMVACCRPCNKARGSMRFERWLASPIYAAKSIHLTNTEKALNINLLSRLAHLKSLRTIKQRSR